MVTKKLKLEEINIEGGTQSRDSLSTETVDEYAETLQQPDGKGLPSIDVVFDGKDYWLWDGFHRYHAHRQAGIGLISCNITNGTKRDAVLLAIGANAAHGLKRSNADKRRAVKMLLNDPKWSKESDRWIAQKAHVSHTFVSSIRQTEKPKSVNVATSSTQTQQAPVHENVNEDYEPRDNCEPQETHNSPQSEIDDFFSGSSKPQQSASPEELAKTEQRKAIKTAEALQRSIDDLQSSKPKNNLHLKAMESCKFVLDVLRSWM